MTTQTADIKIGVNLIDDYLYLQQPEINTGDLRNRFLVVQDSTSDDLASELLTVDPNGQLLHFKPDPSSSSGWDMVSVAVDKPEYASTSEISRLAAFYQDGLLNALCYFDRDNGGSCATWMQYSADGGWSKAVLNATVDNCLGFTYQTDLYLDGDGNHYLYGVTGNYVPLALFVVSFDSTSGEWTVIGQDMGFSPALTPNSAFRMSQGSDGNAFTLLWVGPDGGGNTQIYYQGATYDYGQFYRTGQQQVFDPQVGSFTTAGLYGLPGDYGVDNLLLIDNSNRLFLIQGYNADSPQMTQLSADQAGQGQPYGTLIAALGVDNNGVLTIFAVEAGSNQLWYIQQQGQGMTDPLTLGSWVQLGGSLTTIAAPTSMIYGPELFGVDQNSASAYHYARTLTDQVWVTAKLTTPLPASSDPTNCSSFAMQLTSIDASGNAVPQQNLQIVADHACTLIYNNLSHAVGPSQPIDLLTDAGGQASISLQAQDLKPPILTVTLVEDSSVSRWVQGDVVQSGGSTVTQPTQSVCNRLQNKDGTRQVSNSALQQPITQDGKTIPALMSPSYDTSDSDAPSAIINIGSWMDPNNSHNDGSIDAGRIPVKHWEIDFTRTDGPRYRALSEAEGLAMLAAAQPAALGSGSSVFGDICHFFKHEFDQLKTFATHVVQDGEQWVLNVVLNGVQYAVQTVKEAGAALETVFSKIAQLADEIYEAIQRVLEWLKMLFEWGDILNTQQVLYYSITSTLDNLSDSVEQAQTDLNSWLNGIKAQVNSAMDGIDQQAVFAGSFNDLANNAQSQSPVTPTGTDALTNQQSQDSNQQHAGRCSFVSGHAQNYYGSSSASLPSTSLSGALASSSSSLATVLSTFEQDVQGQSGFQAALNDIEQAFAALFTDPSKFFSELMSAVLVGGTALVDLALDTIEATLDALLDLVVDAINAGKSLLTEHIDIPLLTWLYENVIAPGEKLNLLGLICLSLAVPVTIIYKLVYGVGNAPFTSSDVSSIKANGLPWPSQLSAPALLLKPGMPTETQAGQQLTTDINMETLGVCAGILMIPGTIFTSSNDLFASIPPDEEDTVLEEYFCYAATLIETVVQAVGAPYSLFDKSDLSIADKATLSLWSAGWLPIISDIAFVFIGTEKKVTIWGDSAIADDSSGPALSAVLHWMVEGIGIWTCIEQALDSNYNGWSCANSAIGPLPGCCAFFLYSPPDGPPAAMGYDFYTGIGAGITVWGGSFG